MRIFFLFLAALPALAETSPDKTAPSAQRSAPAPKAAPASPKTLSKAKAKSAKTEETKPRHRKGFVPIPNDLKSGVAQQGKKTPPPFKRSTVPAKNEEVFLEAPVTPPQPEADTAALTGAPEPIGTLPAGVCQNRPPIETYMQISSVYQPRPSKKGGLFFVSDLRETPQLYFTKSPNHWPEQITFFPDGVSFFELSPDGNRILVATQTGGNEQFDIQMVEPTKKNVTPLVMNPNKRVESFLWAKSGRWFAYTSNERNGTDMDLYRFDMVSLKSTLLAELKGSNRVADISPDENWIAMENAQSATDSDILLFSLADKKVQIPSQHSGAQNHEWPRFSADSKGLFLISDAVAGRREVFFHKLGEKYPGLALTQEKAETEKLVLDEKRERLGVYVNRDGYGTFQWAPVTPRGAVVGKWAELKTDPGVIGAARFGEGKSIFYTFSNSRRTWDAWESKGVGKPVQWTQSTNGNLDTNCFLKEELVSYPSFDGKEIPAFLYLPSSTAREIPFIVYIHGGPEAQFRPVFNKTFQYFLQNGFGILAPNVRGSTGYGREFTMADDYKKRMDSVQDGIFAGKWLLEKRYAAAGKLAVYGGSYGGFMVLRMLQVDPQMFAAASESVGISNFVTFLKNTKPYRRALREAEYGPLSDEEFLKSISPTSYVDVIKTPLLIFHGANDPRVPVSESEQIAEALKDKGVAVELKVFADEGHGNTKLRNILEQARLMTRFFESHLVKKEISSEKK